ncbi:MAG: mechanosensitive ion channel family protein [Phycisphaerales bacterium]|nr:MAG: mechanosensitive ion channel family protein [Phycisphaerales bacterium]
MPGMAATFTTSTLVRARILAWALALCAAALLTAPAAVADIDAPGPPASLNSPRATMFSFLEAMHRVHTAPAYAFERRQAMEDAVGCLDLNAVTRAAGADTAVQLLGVLNRIGEVRMWSLPDRAEVLERGLETYVYFPNPEDPAHRALIEAAPDGRIVFSVDERGAWRFSADTVAGVSALYRAVEHLPVVFGVDERALSVSLRIRSLMPPSLREGEVIGVEYWQWIGLLLVILIAATVDTAVRFFLAAFATRWIARKGEKPEADTLKRTVRPFGLFAAALLLPPGLWVLGMPDVALFVLTPAIHFFLMLAGVWAGFRVTDLVSEVFAKRAARTRTKFDDLLVPMIRRAVKIFILVFGLIYIAQSMDIEILPLLTGLGIGGLAFAFAAKDTIENFFGSVAVLVDRPFEVGDWVRIGEVEGIVSDLGFRSTRIRTFYNSLVTMPNATLVRATVDNYGRRRYRRTWQTLGIAYNTAPERIESFCEGIRELIRLHPYTRKDFYAVNFTAFKDDSLEILVCVFHECPDWQTELRERQRLFVDIVRLANRLGVEFAFPTQTLYLRRDDGELPPAAPTPGPDADTRAIRDGRREAQRITRDASWRGARPPPEQIPVDPLGEPEDPIEDKTSGG